MLSLAELLKAIDKFYRIATDFPALIKLAAGTPMYEKVSEEVWNNLIDEDFANEFERYLEVYNLFMADLQARDPNEVVEILTAPPGQDSQWGGETFKDLFDTLGHRAEAMKEGAYLTQSPEDKGWQERLSPQQIDTGINEIYSDALDSMVDATKGKLTREEVINIFTTFSEAQLMEQTYRMQGESEEDYKQRVNEKQQQYSREYADRMANLRMILDQEGRGDKDIGAQILHNYRLNLENQIRSETDAVKKQELERRLRDMPDPSRYQKQLAANQARYERIQTDPVKGPEYNARRAPRQRKARNRRAEMLVLIDQYLKAVSPNDKARLAEKIINLREQILLSSNYKLDAENKAGVRLRERPNVSRILNIDNIIKEFTGRKERVKREEKEKYQRGKTEFAAGTLTGLIFKLKEKIALMVSDKAVKKINTIWIKTDPALVPIKQEMDKHPEGSPQFLALKEKLKNMLANEPFKSRRENHELFVKLSTIAGEVRAWRDELDILDKNIKQRAKDGELVLTDTDKQIIADLMNRGVQLKKYGEIGNTSEIIDLIIRLLYQMVQ